jgi:hypothetical protein
VDKDARPYGGFSAEELNIELEALRTQLAQHLASYGDANHQLWFKWHEAALRASIRAVAAEVHMQAIEEYTGLFPDRQVWPERYTVELRQVPALRRIGPELTEVVVTTRVGGELWAEHVVVDQRFGADHTATEVLRRMLSRRHGSAPGSEEPTACQCQGMAHEPGCQVARLWDGFRRWDELTKRPRRTPFE